MADMDHVHHCVTYATRTEHVLDVKPTIQKIKDTDFMEMVHVEMLVLLYCMNFILL